MPYGALAYREAFLHTRVTCVQWYIAEHSRFIYWTSSGGAAWPWSWFIDVLVDFEGTTIIVELRLHVDPAHANQEVLNTRDS